MEKIRFKQNAMKLLCLFVIFITLFSCTTTENNKQGVIYDDKDKKQLIVNEEEDKEQLIVNDDKKNYDDEYWENAKVFKQWLNDTLKILYASPVKYRREIIIDDDSLSLDIINYYNVNIRKKYTGNYRDIINAIGTLEFNGVQVPTNYNLELQIEYSYTVSMVEQLLRLPDEEISLFKISYDNKVIEYDFCRGRLNDSLVCNRNGECTRWTLIYGKESIPSVIK